ncbi:MAG TPA: ATP-binding protein [Mycobacteriales bacterium]|nr:ATP-binding protein [Mycobacteriales bacterium]
MIRARSLRTRLLLTLVSLLAAACAVVGLVTEVSLHRFLVGQLDTQLAAAGERSAAASRDADGGGGPRGGPADGPGGGRGGDHGGPGFLLAPGQAAGTLGVQLTAGKVSQSAVLDSTGASRPLPAGLDAAFATLPVDGRPHTRALGPLGDYRLLASRTPGGEVLVTGLPMAGVRATLVRLGALLVAVTAAGLLAVALAGALLVRLALRPLTRVAATADRVAELPLDRGEVALAVRVPAPDADPRTEVGRVGQALNAMLRHVASALAARQASETRVRQFVADASHELRTPLAAIRGYAELSRHPRAQAPADVRHALGRVESEAQRMGTLVEDLLLLARLDSGRPLASAPVELSRLVVDAVEDAHATAPEHRWRLDLPDEPVVVTGDADRLHQVLANLLANARTHTPPGSTVTAGLAVVGGEVELSVTDDGPGMPASLVPEVFGRFVRGDSSRSRAAGSTGLGLAIVAAVVQAHRGAVEVTSRPGRTVFTVRLPAAGRQPQLARAGLDPGDEA